jgi:hypothetical protein
MTNERVLPIALAVVLFLSGTPILYPQNLVTVTGLVYDAATKAPIPGARITSTSVPAAGAAPSVFRTRSLADGTVALTVVPGKHAVCVDAGKPYLDPCRWPANSGTAASALVDTAQSQSSVALALTKGVLVNVNIVDPTGAVGAARKASPALTKVPAPPVSVMLRPTTGVPVPVPFVFSGSAVSQFSIVVPPNTPLALTVTSTVLALADASGNPLPSNILTTTFVSPDAAAGPGPTWMFGLVSGSRIPSTVIGLTIKGLL